MVRYDGKIHKKHYLPLVSPKAQFVMTEGKREESQIKEGVTDAAFIPKV